VVRFCSAVISLAAAFQAEYEGSIPFTRSKPFNQFVLPNKALIEKE
jgi:hypothetical protein